MKVYFCVCINDFKFDLPIMNEETKIYFKLLNISETTTI